MVVLLVKRGSEGIFLYETSVHEKTAEAILEITYMHNGIQKVNRICSEMEELAAHGTMLPSEMIGLTDEQIEELKLVDIWAEKCIPSGGFIFNKDPMGRRNGQQPKENMVAVLSNAAKEAKDMINKNMVLAGKPLTLKIIQQAIDILRGGVTIVYPMQLPPHDPIRMEFTNTEDLSGTQASRDVIEPSKSQLWFAGRQILPEKTLGEYIGLNEKCKVIVKLNQLGDGPPGREAIINDELRRNMMADAYRRQEELKDRSNTQHQVHISNSMRSNETSFESLERSHASTRGL